MQLTITRTKNDASIAAAAKITNTRGGRTADAVPPMVTAVDASAIAGTATAKPYDAKKEKYPANPLNIVVINPEYNKVLWGVRKAHYRPMRKVVEYFRSTNPTPP